MGSSFLYVSIAYYMQKGGRGSRKHVKMRTKLMEGPLTINNLRLKVALGHITYTISGDHRDFLQNNYI